VDRGVQVQAQLEGTGRKPGAFLDRPAEARYGRVRVGTPLYGRKIAQGLTSEDAAIACGVSGPLGSRWFRERGGMPSIQLGPKSGRYLSFAEREEIAQLRRGMSGPRDCSTAGAVAVDDLS
jgi:hypothetical protein